MTEPCTHPEAWAPEALTFGGALKEALFDVVCMSCGRQFKVPLSLMPKEPSDAQH